MLALTLPLLILPLLSVTSAQNTTATTSSGQTITWVNCSSHIPEPLQGAPLPPLPETLKCGQLVVPMDYTKELGDGNSITLGFAMYRPPKPQGLLNYNPGGPGVEVASYAWQLALNVSEGPYLQELSVFDFLAIDVRGSFQSNPLNCSTEAFGLFPSSYPTNESSYLAIQSRLTSWVRSCDTLSTPRNITGFVGSREVIQDWDAVRAALGWEKMSLFGTSYGTFQNENYALKYPCKVNRLVSDGPAPRGITLDEIFNAKLASANRLLERADAFCMQDPTCPFSRSKGSVLQAWSRVLNTTSAPNSPVTPDDIRALPSFTTFQLAPDFANFNGALYLASQGNLSVFNYTEFSALLTPSLLTAVPVFCSDRDYGNFTYDSFKAHQASSRASDRNDFQFAVDVHIAILCGGWPFPRTADDGTSPVSVPMLLVTSDYDYNTPTEWTDPLFRRSPNATLIVRHGDAHGSIQVIGEAHSLMVNYLLTGTVPSATSNANYSVYTTPSNRTIPDPYSVALGLVAGDAEDPGVPVNTTNAAGNGTKDDGGKKSGARGRWEGRGWWGLMMVGGVMHYVATHCI